MNESNHTPNHREFDNKLVDSLRTLKPRPPRLDWDAIRAAHDAEDSASSSAKPSSIFMLASGRHLVAWCSGMAAGVAITFFAMQWLVLNDLRAKVERLERTANGAAKSTTSNPSLNDRGIAGTRSAFDVNLLLDAPNLSAGSYRGPSDRFVHASPFAGGAVPLSSANLDDGSRSQYQPATKTTAGESDSVDRATDRFRLQQDLQRDIY